MQNISEAPLTEYLMIEAGTEKILIYDNYNASERLDGLNSQKINTF